MACTIALACRDKGQLGGTTGAVVVSGAQEGFIDQPPVPLPAFELTAADGRLLHAGDLVGQWTVLFFGYTSCPDVCPETLGRLKQAFAGIGDRTPFQAIFVSVDPERDTAEQLRGYLSHFDAAFIGASGDKATLDSLTQAVGASYELPESRVGAYAVGHSSALFVIDPEARRVGLFTSTARAAAIAQRLVQLKKEYAPHVVVHDAWVRAAPPQAPALAGYLSLGNATSLPITLTGCKSELFERVELHQTSIQGGMARMQPVDKLSIAPGSRVQLSPGGYHLMLIAPKRTLHAGEEIPLELDFEAGPPMTLNAVLRDG